MSAILTLDDTDPSIVYSAGWTKAGSKLEYNSTTSSTSIAGTTATVTFTGTSIGVFGTIPARQLRLTAPVSTYSIDGGAPVPFIADQTVRTQYSQLFFQSPVLPAGEHKLVISHPMASAPLFLDFMQVSFNTVQPTSASPSATSVLPLNTTSLSQTSSATSSTTLSLTSSSIVPSSTSSEVITPPATSLSQNTVTETIRASPTPSALNNGTSAGDSTIETSASKSSSNAGAIAGGIIGAVAVLALLAFGVMWWWRRRQQKKWQDEFLDSTPNWAPTGAATTGSSANYGNSQTAQSMNQADSMRTYPFAAPQQPRYPGGYAPSPSPAVGANPGMYNQNPGYGGPAPSQYGAGYEDAYGGYEGANASGYTGNGYTPPSQLMQAQNNTAYGAGMRPY